VSIGVRCLCWLAVASTACGLQVRPHGHQSPPVISGPKQPGILPDDSISFSFDASRRSKGGGVWRTCRSIATPDGWIIVDYFIADDCPVVQSERFNGMVLVLHTTMGRGARLLICSNQRVPPGWGQRTPKDHPLAEQCRSSASTRPVTDRVVEIEKR